MSYADERHIRDDRYQKALSALTRARVAHSSWDRWGEDEALEEAMALVSELFYSKEGDR